MGYVLFYYFSLLNSAAVLCPIVCHMILAVWMWIVPPFRVVLFPSWWDLDMKVLRLLFYFHLFSSVKPVRNYRRRQSEVCRCPASCTTYLSHGLICSSHLGSWKMISCFDPCSMVINLNLMVTYRQPLSTFLYPLYFLVYFGNMHRMSTVIYLQLQTLFRD